MGFWNRLFGRKGSPTNQPARDVPESALEAVQTLRCDPHALDPEQRFSVGRWGLRVADDEDSQRFAQGVLRRSAGKTLRLEPHKQAGHRGVISSPQSGEGGGYSWLYVDVDLRKGVIRFHQSGTEQWQQGE